MDVRWDENQDDIEEGTAVQLFRMGHPCAAVGAQDARDQDAIGGGWCEQVCEPDGMGGGLLFQSLLIISKELKSSSSC
jgi:hypothetical protein